MSASVFAFLAQVKERGAQLPQPLSAALLLAAVRLSEKNGQAVRPDLLVVDDDGGLTLRKGSPDRNGPYSAPELSSEKISPRDPRVLVYAAGALGYELCTLETPRPGAPTDGLLLAPVIQKALAAERKDRYRSLEEMAQAIQELQKRPTNDEERLILTAVVQSTAAPKTVAKVPTRKIQAFYALDPKDAPEVKADEPAESFPKRASPFHGWDPQDRTPRVVFPKETPPQAVKVEPKRVAAAAPPLAIEAVGEAAPTHAKQATAAPPAPASSPEHGASRTDSGLERLLELSAELQADRKARAEEFALFDARLDALGRLAGRIEVLEKHPAAAVPQRPGRREVKEMLDDRRFAEAERALRGATHDDAGLQMLLGQALAGQTDPDGTRTQRAEAAFRRAAELDTAWAQPKALLGALLVKQGRRAEATLLLQAALATDPGNPDARAALGTGGPRRPLWPVAALGSAAGAAAALAVVFSVRASPPIVLVQAAPPAAAPHAPAVETATPVAVALPLPAPTPAPEQQRDEPAQSAPAARPEKPSRPRKTASADTGKRSQAVAEAARGDKALRAFDTAGALVSFQAALRLDPGLGAAHRGMGMVYVLQGSDAQAKAEYRRYLEIQPDAADRGQIERLLSR